MAEEFHPSRDPFFDPNCDDGKMRCCCGYELLKQDDGITWKCSGGNHRYNVQEGSQMVDKFGNILLKTPEDTNEPSN